MPSFDTEINKGYVFDHSNSTKNPLNAISYIQLRHITWSNWVQYNYRQGNTTCKVSEKGAVQMPIPYIDVCPLLMFVFESLL